MAGLFRDGWKNVLALILICAVVFGGILLASSLIKGKQVTDKGEDITPAARQTAASRLLVYPEKYATFMSSTPGIRILAQYTGNADKVKYSATSGGFLTWDVSTGKITTYEQTVELPLNEPVYWSPFEKDEVSKDTEITVKAVIMDGNTGVTEKQVEFILDSSTNFYSVTASADVIAGKVAQLLEQSSKTIDEAVSSAILAQGKGYGSGEVSAEGHVILEKEEKDGKIKAYTISSYGAFGFENGIFTKVSGSGAIPTVMTFIKNEFGEYSLLDYKEPLDGSENIKSKKEMFPERLWDKVLSENKYYPELARQQENQAKLYLQSIGRNAEVSEAFVEKKLPDINVEASNKLFAEFTKYDTELNNFPYWLGTKELIVDGIRYIYETSQSETDDGYDLITFRKTENDGTVIKEYLYKIVGNEPLLMVQD